MELIEKFKSAIDYNPVTGKAYWKHRFDRDARWNTRYAGTEIGTTDKDGYLTFKFEGKYYRLHRVIWAIVKGYFPTVQIDHDNRVVNDNRFDNLREATHNSNIHNRIVKRGKSGLIGVRCNSGATTWRATIKNNGKTISLGSFACIFQAAKAYDKAAKELHGEFAITNF